MSTEQSRPSVTLLTLTGVLLLLAVVFGGVAIADHQGDGYISGTVETESGTADDIQVVIQNNSSGAELYNFTLSEGQSFDNLSVSGGHKYDVIVSEPISQTEKITVNVSEGEYVDIGTVTLNSTGDAEIHGTFDTENNSDGWVEVRNGTGDLVENVSVDAGTEYSAVVAGGTGPYNVTAKAPDHDSISKTVSVDSGNRTQVNFSLSETEPGYLEGTPTLENDQGQNITVDLIDANTGVIVNSTAVPSGVQYNMSAEPGDYTARFSASGHQNYTKAVTLQNGTTTTLSPTLAENQPYIAGNVSTERNDYSGEINITIENSTGSLMNETTLVGGGDYNLTVPQDNGTFTVIANSSDHNKENQTVEINNSSDSKENVNFSLTQTDRGDYEIEATTEDGNGTDIEITVQEVSQTEVVGEGGSYRFDLPTGSYTVTIEEEGYKTLTTTINNSGSYQFKSYQLQIANGTINGTVNSSSADSTQQFNVTVQETGDTQTVTNGGNFSFELEPGDYNVTANASGFSSDTKAVSLTANTTENIVLEPYKPSNISVSLTLENTNDASEGNVTVKETGNTYTIGHNNSTTITGLEPGIYTLTANATGHLEQTTQVNTTGGETSQVNFSLQDDGDSGTVAFSAETEDGNASKIQVDILETGQTFYLNETETRQVELAQGNYTFVGNADGYNETSQTISVESNTTQSLTLTLNKSDTTKTVDAEGVRIENGNSYWVGQKFYRGFLDNYTEVRWENDVTGLTINRSIDSDDVYRDSVKNITDARGENSDYTFYGVNSSGNTTQIANVFLGVQEMDVSFSPNESVDKTEVTFNSNRNDGYEVIITQDSNDTNQLSTQEIADLYGQNLSTELRTIDGTTYAVATIPSGSTTAQMNVSALERAEYNFRYKVVDTPTKATANVTLVVAPFEGEADATITDGGRYWLGQRLEASENINDGETISVYTEGGQFLQEVTADEFGTIQIRTTSIGTGSFYLQDSDGNKIANFTVERQTISANFTDDSVLNAGSQSESGLTVESNRAGYNLLVSAKFTNSTGTTKEVSAGTLAQAFNASTKTVNGKTYVVFQDISNLQTFILDARSLSEGNYTFTVQSEDANASDTAEIGVSVPVDGQALFTDQFYTHNRGDVAEITIDFSGDSRNTTVKIGRYDRVGYELTAKITRDSNVGQTTLYFNTSAAGQGTPSEALKAKNGTVDLVVKDETKLPGDRKLASARYLMELKVENQTTDLSTLNLFDSGVMSGDIYGVPPTVSSVGSSSVVMDNAVTMDEIDSRSYVVVGFKVTGLEIQMNESRRTASDFDKNSAFAQQSGISVNFTKDNTGINNPTHEVSPANALQYHYIPLNNGSTENNTAMAVFVFSPSEFNTEGDGEYTATMSIDSRKNAFVETDMNSSTSFTFVESETKFDRHWSGDILVLPEENQTISGTTTLPPGTNLTHEIRSDNVRYPFYQSQEIVVQDDGTFQTTYDFGNVPVGLDFNTSIPSQMDNKSVSVVSEIQPLPPEQMSNVTVFTQVNGEPTPAEITLGETSVDTSGSTSPPRQTVYVKKDTHTVQGTVEVNGTNYTINKPVTIEDDNANIVVNFNESGGGIEFGDPRDEPETYTVTVRLVNASNTSETVDGLVRLDGSNTKVATNGTVTYEVTAGEYVFEGQAHQYTSAQQEVTVSEDRTVTLALEPNKPETVDVTNNTTNNTTSQTPGQPGFGVVVALIALLGATFLARRE